MLKTIRKRDAQVVPFDRQKIVDALVKAGLATNEFGVGVAKAVTGAVVENLAARFDGSTDEEMPGVEQVQDMVEDELFANGFIKTGKAYVLYRSKRADVRNLDRGLDMIDEYLEGSDWRLKENSNMSFSLQGLNNHLSGAISAKYWLDKVYSPEIGAAHRNGDMHVHDLSQISVYCVGWDLMDLLVNGFQGVKNKVSAGPAKHLSAVLGQVFNFMYTMQGEAAGAQAFSSFDTLLAPFVRFDKMSYKELKQQMQEFVFNMNTSTRVGFSVPFTNLTMDLCPSPNYAKTPVIIGGKPWMKETANLDEQEPYVYGEFQTEMDMINRAFAEVMLEGDANGRVFTFPIPTYNVTADFDWDNPVYTPIWEMAGKYGIPYFANFIGSDLNPEDCRSMCCRLRLSVKDLNKRNGGMFGAAPLTGSMGVVTINLPRIGFQSKDDTDFFSRLGHVADLAAESLAIKRKTVERLTDQGLYPYSRFFLRKIKARDGQYWTNHFCTIGIIGMNEALTNFFGFGIDDPRGKEFAERVMDYLRNKIVELQKKYDCLFNLEATPAEGVTYRLAKIDKEKFPAIKTAVESCGLDPDSAPFYTNSTHLPVSYSDDMFRVLQHQESLQTKYTGGTVLHGFLGSSLSSPEAVKQLVKRVTHAFKIPYFTLTPTFSVCPKHGFIAGEQWTCPDCGEETEVYSRIVGYYRPVSQWNKGKQAEFKARRTYTSPE